MSATNYSKLPNKASLKKSQDFLDVNATAKYLGIAVRQLYNLNYTKLGPPYVQGHHRIYYRKDDLDKWCLERDIKTQKSKPEPSQTSVAVASIRYTDGSILYLDDDVLAELSAKVKSVPKERISSALKTFVHLARFRGKLDRVSRMKQELKSLGFQVNLFPTKHETKRVKVRAKARRQPAKNT